MIVLHSIWTKGDSPIFAAAKLFLQGNVVSAAKIGTVPVKEGLAYSLASSTTGTFISRPVHNRQKDLISRPLALDDVEKFIGRLDPLSVHADNQVGEGAIDGLVHVKPLPPGHDAGPIRHARPPHPA